MRAKKHTYHPSQSFRDGHLEFSSQVDCCAAGVPFGQRNPRHDSCGAEESPLGGPGTTSAKLKGLLPFLEMYCSLAFPLIFPFFASCDNIHEFVGAVGILSPVPFTFGALDVLKIL